MKSESSIPTDSPTPPPAEFLVVGIGGSAGALEEFNHFLAAIPAAPGLAIIVVQHLGPHHPSLLVELLSRVSKMPVQWAAPGERVAPNQVYVAPPAQSLEVREGQFVLHSRPRASGLDGVIDLFFSSIADTYKHRAVGVVLSGTGSDGARGMRAIKAGGGMTFAQIEDSATFGAMPHAAVESGAVDRVLPTREIANELVRLARDAHAAWKSVAADVSEGEPHAKETAAIFRILDLRTGVDFSEYKTTTLRRRLVRRMALTRTSRLPDYVKLLQNSREEVRQLYESLLINVTEFFRDSETFDFLAKNVLPGIMERHGNDSPIRIWVPGCSTGEEAYSYGIILSEVFEAQGRVLPVQIFGTDLSDEAIAVARAGAYRAADLAAISPARLRRYFYRTERGYVIQKQIRDMCVFARQNVVRDSPFSRLDLISCRNLLIYLGPGLQRKVMPIFHYALSPHGILVLGKSESVGSHVDLFRLIDRSLRVYSRMSGIRSAPLQFPIPHLLLETTKRPLPESTMAHDPKEARDAVREADRIVLDRHAPAGVLVDDDLEILQFRGEVSPYLAPLAGRASLNLIKMARDGLAMELKAAVQEARDKKARVRRPQITITQDGGEPKRLEVDVTPIAPSAGSVRCYLILFIPVAEPVTKSGASVKKSKQAARSAQVEQLSRDLQATRSFLHAAIEQHESTNQELRSANEEIQSSNEELQSTNEELETAKEELQSTNEELTTVNEELHSRQVELIQVNNDLHNLINSVHLPIIMLSHDLRIRRFTPVAEKMLNLIPSDIGRPFTDINTNLKLEELPRLITEVTDTLTVREFEVQDSTGRWHLMRIRPYKTAENKIDGVVMTLIDIDQMKRMISELEETKNVAQAITEMSEQPLAVLSETLEIRVANEAFYRMFLSTREAMQGRSFVELVRRPGVPAAVRDALEKVIPQHSTLEDFRVRLEFPGMKAAEMRLRARQIASGGRTYPLILVSFHPAD